MTRTKQLTCIYCKQHWNIADNELSPKTAICFQCKIQKFGYTPKRVNTNMAKTYEEFRKEVEA